MKVHSRIACSLLVIAGASAAMAIPPHKALFDATKAEMAGNADWVVDADVHNVGTGSGGAMVVGSGTDSNPQRFPTPAATGITPSTPETYWTGSLSAWGVALVQHGISVETLPIGGRITYGDSTNAQDLSNYSLYIVDEPNIVFTAAEKTAIINWVHDGGGLFMISDHSGSDRNNDGTDSVGVWNGLLNSNSTGTNPFGITFNADNLVLNSTFVDTTASDPVTHGTAGSVGEMDYHNGASLTISTAQNSSVKIAIWTTSSHTSSNGMVAYATYGLGRVVACGDSSPFDDGTGDPGDSLFNGWSGEANGDHGKLAINGSIWLDNPPSGAAVACCTGVGACAMSVGGTCTNGGTLGAAGSTCTPNTCSQVACCVASGGCALSVAGACTNGGTLGAAGSTCAPNTCSQVACCTGSGACAFSVGGSCANGGTPGAAGSTCTPNTCSQVACCTSAGACALSVNGACGNGGTLGAAGSTCTPNTCPPPACGAPSVGTISPVNASDGSQAFISVGASGTGTLSYQWRRGGVPLSDGGEISGSATSALTFTPAKAADAGMYDVVVTNTCASTTASTTSNAVAVTVVCRPDFDGSGVITVQDIFAFLNAWFAGDPRADFDGVNGLQVGDIFVFLNAWFAGCP
jgi:hypothetical protein